MLLRTRVTLFVCLAFIVVTSGLLLAGWQSEQMTRALHAQDVINGQKTVWQEIASSRVQNIESSLSDIHKRQRLVGAVEDEDRDQISLIADVFFSLLKEQNIITRLEIIGRDGEILYNSGNELFWSASIGAVELDDIILRQKTVRGVGQDANRRMIAMVAVPIADDLRVTGALVLSYDIQPNLLKLKQSIAADVLIANRRGRLIQGTADALWEEMGGIANLNRDELLQTLSLNDKYYSIARFNIEGINGSAIAEMLTAKDITQEFAEQRRVKVIVLIVVSVVLLSILIALFRYLQSAFRPMNEAIAVLEALARGDTMKTLETSHREDEIGNIAKAVEVFREHTVSLESMKRSREKQRRRQERYIRQEMTRLADTLDEGAKEAVMDDLKEIEQSSSLAMERHEVSNELGTLAIAFERMAGRVREQHHKLAELIDELREALKAKTQYIALQQELNIARDIQLALLPKTVPERAGIELIGQMIPAKEVGGDFYDFIVIDENRIGIVVADVSGKGVPAAFFMAIAKTLLRATALFGNPPGLCLARLNNLLEENNEQELFVTVFYGILDQRNGHFRYANGGHNPPMWIKNDGTVEALPLTGGMALAIMDDMDYDESEIRLQPGESLFFYTDGVTEATDIDEQEFTEPRLMEVLQNKQQHTAEDINALIFGAVHEFERGASQADDITCVSLKYNGHRQS